MSKTGKACKITSGKIQILKNEKIGNIGIENKKVEETKGIQKKRSLCNQEIGILSRRNCVEEMY